MKGYDCNFIISKITEQFQHNNINLIGRNTSNIFYMGVDNLVKIIDSHEYIMSSLSSLFTNLNENDIKYTQTLISKYNLDNEFVVKDILPYTYINSV